LDTVVQVPAPEGLDRRLNPVAAPCALSIAGFIQITVMAALPGPWVRSAALGAFGAVVAVVAVLVADHALLPAGFVLWI
jgi:hypothetical protein